MTELVAVTSYPARLEAEIAKGFLEVNGITAEIEADDAGGVHQFPAYSFGGRKESYFSYWNKWDNLSVGIKTKRPRRHRE